MNKLIISISGIRGVTGESLDPAFFTKFASAFGTFVNGGKVIIGRDTRRSGEMLKQAILAGLLATGCEVIDTGVCPTPTNLYAAGQLQVGGAITITASHNPIDWNGIELAKANGDLFDEADRMNLMKIFESEKIRLASWDKVGIVKKINDAVDRHIRKILSLPYIDEKVISAKAPKVVIDCVNGAGSVISPQLLDRLGCEVVELNCVPDGNFQREPEPTPDNLEELCDLVRKENADIGFAHDADADRLTIVTEKGEALSGEYTLALAADFMLSKLAKGQKGNGAGGQGDPSASLRRWTGEQRGKSAIRNTQNATRNTLAPITNDSVEKCTSRRSRLRFGGADATKSTVFNNITNHQSPIGSIVANISTSQMIEDIARKHDVPVYRSKVGCGYVVQKMRETNALIGGEGTGGVIFPDVHYTTDGITCLALFAQMLAVSDRPISAMVDEIPRYFMTKQKVRIKSPQIASKLIEIFVEKHFDETLDLTDGVKLIRGDSWVIVRKSGTEPVIRIFSEARTQKDADVFCNEIFNELQSET